MVNRFAWALLAFLPCLTSALHAESERLDLNDITWLWPAPQSVDDLERVISISDLQAADGAEVWSNSQFEDLLREVDGDAGKVDGHAITLPSSVRTKSAWKVAAFRVDATAPGGHEVIRRTFGERPQIRLILQPVTVADDQVEVHDSAVHLVYDFTVAQEGGAFGPDKQKFNEIIGDLRRLKALAKQHGIETTGKPLGVHPGLRAGVPELQTEVQGFLAKHLHPTKVRAIAIIGIDPPEPWIFLALAQSPAGDRFAPVPFLPTQMINFLSGPPEIVPQPKVNNLNPEPSGPMMPADATKRIGVSTAPLFGQAMTDLDNYAIVSMTDAGDEVRHQQIRNRDIPDIIAHPDRSHFFNTDCVSCHTETRRRMRLSLQPGEYAFRQQDALPEVDPAALPQDDWNVRNIGWFQPPGQIGGGLVQATLTMRTANETAKALEFIEQHYPSESSVAANGGTRTRYLNQGWSEQERQDFYYLGQGSQLVPYDWFLSLELANGNELLRSDASLRKFGFIPQQPTSPRNPDGLPIGFVKDSNPSTIAMKAGFLGPDYDRKAYPVTNDWLGFTCAACHTADIVYEDRTIRIDGGAAMTDLESFLAELAKSLRATVTDDDKYQRFEQRVRQQANSDIDTTDLRNRVKEYAPVIERLVANNQADHPYGLGRLDAFGAILNQICAGSLEIPENARPSSAPVSYPFLWYTPQMDWVQWNSSVNIPIARNVGEVLGVFAHVQLTGTPAEGQFDSSARIDYLDRLESTLTKLRAPAWPEDLLGKIDREQAAAGKQLFKQHCANCHNSRDEHGHFAMTEPNKYGKRFIRTHNIRFDEIGTDPQMAINFVTRLAKPGDLAPYIDLDEPATKASLERLQRLFAALGLPQPDFREQVPAGTLLSAAVSGVIAKQMQRELANRTPKEKKKIMRNLEGGHTSQPLPNGGAGYKAGPLSGVWATAPFGHAGSVPNLYQWLLPEEKRVKSFHVGNRTFDPKHVGFSTEPTEVSFLLMTETDSGEPIPGNSNKGHSGEHHTDFTDDERWQIIEYIKTLK